jgi:hypothetical protein
MVIQKITRQSSTYASLISSMLYLKSMHLRYIFFFFYQTVSYHGATQLFLKSANQMQSFYLDVIISVLLFFNFIGDHFVALYIFNTKQY